MEELYNGKQIPVSIKSSISSTEVVEKEFFEDLEDVFKLPDDEFQEIRISKLLPNPQPLEEEKYESFFTSVTFMTFEEKRRRNRSQSLTVEHPLVQFYEKLGISNQLVVEKITFETMRELIKLISRGM